MNETLTPDMLEPYQRIAIKHMVNNKSVQLCGGAGLFLEMGLGKTVSALSAFEVLRQRGLAKRMLVIAPVRVAIDTWPEEIMKWSHLRHLKYQVITGDLSATKRERILAETKADVVIINTEMTPWLCAYYNTRKWPFHVVCVDELSMFKSEKSHRWKVLKAKTPLFRYTWGLTGTPASNGMRDVWAQVYLLDRGERLGEEIEDYLDEFFVLKHIDQHRTKPVLKIGSKRQGKEYYREKIFERISDICISMKSDDWLKMPPQIERKYDVKLSDQEMDDYEEFEREKILEIEGDILTADNAAALSNKLLQFANGAVYSNKERTAFREVHEAKIDALEEILEQANGQPILCFYRYKHDVERILNSKKLKRFKPVKLPKNSRDSKKCLDSWNKGEILFLLAHPKSAGHGLNMQHGGHNVVWFGLPWSLDQFLQANARLRRKGQKDRVIIHVISVRGTLDEKVAKALLDKEEGQESLMNYLNVKRTQYLKQAA